MFFLSWTRGREGRKEGRKEPAEIVPRSRVRVQQGMVGNIRVAGLRWASGRRCDDSMSTCMCKALQRVIWQSLFLGSG